MAYRWKPSKAKRREFSERMKDPNEQLAYEQRKSAKAEKRRKNSKFDYKTAGGEYKATEYQNDEAFKFLNGVYDVNLTEEQETACNMVIMAYSCNEKTLHDYIHVVNELIRKL